MLRLEPSRRYFSESIHWAEPFPAKQGNRRDRRALRLKKVNERSRLRDMSNLSGFKNPLHQVLKFDCLVEKLPMLFLDTVTNQGSI